MPLPLFDINQAMKGAWEAGSSNDKLLQVDSFLYIAVFIFADCVTSRLSVI